MKLIRNIIFFAFGISILLSIYQYFEDTKKEAQEESKRQNKYNDNLTNCYYDPYSKMESPYFQYETGYIKPDRYGDLSLPLKIKTYIKTGPSNYEEAITKLPAFTKVKVIDEELHDVGYGDFKGYLKVRCIDTLQNNTYLITDNSFSVIDYRKCPIDKAISNGPVLAKYSNSKILPIGSNGNWTNIPEKSVIIIKNKPNISDSRARNFENYMECDVYDIKRKTYINNILFDTKSLTIIE